MKLTIEIPDAHAGELIQFLASITAKDTPQPEPTDPTQRIVPIPDEMLPLPPLPKGYSKWVGRGTFEGQTIRAKGKKIAYWDLDVWETTSCLSLDFFHIEAIK